MRAVASKRFLRRTLFISALMHTAAILFAAVAVTHACWGGRVHATEIKNLLQ
eukprot:SAG31_NODE_36413_length_313_cov_1.210280_1_plen_51_part_10